MTTVADPLSADVSFALRTGQKAALITLKQTLQHLTQVNQPTAWPVPNACAQPYHPGSGSYRQLSRPIRAHRYSIAIKPYPREVSKER